MKSFHVQTQLTSEAAIHQAGSAQHALRADAETHFIPDPCLIHLQPLLAEIAGGDIADAETLARADEFLLLRSPLTPDDITDLADTLLRFLYALSQQSDSTPPRWTGLAVNH